MKDCRSGNHDFIGSFVSCMKAKGDVPINSFLDSLRLDIRKLVAMVQNTSIFWMAWMIKLGQGHFIMV